MKKTVVTQYDPDTGDYEVVLPENEDEAFDQAANMIMAQRKPEKASLNKETAAPRPADAYSWYVYKGNKPQLVKSAGSKRVTTLGGGTRFGLRKSHSGKKIRMVTQGEGITIVYTLDAPTVQALLGKSKLVKKAVAYHDDETRIKHKGLRGSNTPKESKDYVEGLGDLGDSGPAEGELPSGGGYEGGDGGAGPGGGVGASIRALTVKPTKKRALVKLESRLAMHKAKVRLQVTNPKEVAAPADTDKQRKLAQIRKKKAQLRQKKADMNARIAHDIHALQGEEIKVKYGNKPKPRAKTPKTTPKKTKKTYVGK